MRPGPERRSAGFDSTRRRLLAGGLAALPVLLAASAGRAQTAVFSAVAVDVRPLVALGDGGARTYLEPALLAALREVFADRIAPGDRRAPVLTARITELFLASYDGNQTADAFGGNDNIEGDGIVSSGGQVLSSTHILTELPPSYSGALVTPGLDVIRYRSIAHQFAYWLRREMGI